VWNPFGIDEKGSSPHAESCASISLLLLKQNNNKQREKSYLSGQHRTGSNSTNFSQPVVKLRPMPTNKKPKGAIHLHHPQHRIEWYHPLNAPAGNMRS
jgi:hypothetical protein